jgi:hypothetical protein
VRYHTVFSNYEYSQYILYDHLTHVVWAPCHHGMARPHIAGGDHTLSTDMEGGNSKYTGGGGGQHVTVPDITLGRNVWIGTGGGLL